MSKKKNEVVDNTLAEIPDRLITLQQAEAMAVEGAAQWMAGQTTVAIALHQIVHQKLFLEEKDENGLPKYKTFEAYWPGLEMKMGISRSQAFNCLRDIRFALGPSFNLDYEMFARLGGTTRFSALPEIVEYNQKTGEVYGLKDGYEVPEGHTVSSFIIEHMTRYAPGEVPELNLNMTQYKDTLKKDLQTGLKLEIEWFLVEVNSPEGTRYRTKYEKRLMNGNEIVEQSEGFIDDPDVEESVMEAYKRRLPIVGLYKFSE